MIKDAGNKISYLVFIFVLFIGSINIVFAMGDSPEDIVKKYYTEDLNGARLSEQTYKNIEPLIAWEHEPGWDTMFIADDVTIHNFKKLSKTEVLVEVRYHIAGIVGSDTLLEYDFTEVIDFFLIQDGKKWKIKKPIFPPHILPSSAIKYLEETIRTESQEDTIRINNLRHVVERLKRLANK